MKEFSNPFMTLRMVRVARLEVVCNRLFTMKNDIVRN